MKEILPLTLAASPTPEFNRVWKEMMRKNCHDHPVWNTKFNLALEGMSGVSEQTIFALAREWSRNMVLGSFWFVRYVSALGARASLDAVRHGLLENAYDESGGPGHTERSHYRLAVKLAGILGFSNHEIECIVPIIEAHAYTSLHYHECIAGDFGLALGMVCLIEEFTANEFALIKRAFLQTCLPGMSMTPDEFIRQGGGYYFDANIEDDARHKKEMPKIVGAWLHSNGVDLKSPGEIKVGLKPIAAGVKYSADLRQHFFDGIWRKVLGS